MQLKQIVLLIFKIFILNTSTLNAQCRQEYRDDVARQVLNSPSVQNWLLEGFELTHDIKFIGLRSGEWDNFSLNLYAGNTYRITARCDRDCSDLDLKIFDDNGNNTKMT